MLHVTCKHFMLNVVMLSVVMLGNVAPLFQQGWLIEKVFWTN
jgi:hypothetical protein